MRHNKMIGWEQWLKTLERVEKFSPWLSRQIAKRTSEWPFWLSGLQIQNWGDRQVWVHLPLSFRNSIDGEIGHGHLVLGAELGLRLLLLRLGQEIPFRYSLRRVNLEVHHRVDQAVDFKFEITLAEWERIRLELAREHRTAATFVFAAAMQDGRLGATVTFDVGFQLEKFLGA